jgi:hypothetical protein
MCSKFREQPSTTDAFAEIAKEVQAHLTAFREFWRKHGDQVLVRAHPLFLPTLGCGQAVGKDNTLTKRGTHGQR